MVNKKMVIICSVIALIVVGAIIAFNIEKLNNQNYIEETNSNNSASQNTVNNTVEEQNNIEDDETKNNEQETNIQEDNTKNEADIQNKIQNAEVTTAEEQKQDLNNRDKALRLAKEEWGEDDTVYYTIDNEQSNVYYITVRSKSTTGSLAEYEVNVSTNEVTIK